MKGNIKLDSSEDLNETKRDFNQYSTKDYYIASFLKARISNWWLLIKKARMFTLYLKEKKKLKTSYRDSNKNQICSL
jgi:hypothetical protein